MDLGLIITILIVLALVGVIVWAADKYLPIPGPLKGIAIFIIIVIGVVWIANKLGVM